MVVTRPRTGKTRPTPTSDVAGTYVRISDDRESEEAGVTRQTEDTVALCATQNLRIHRVYSDNDTGASTRSRKPRPGYDALLADARAGTIGVIVAYSSSRLTRRPMELEAQIKLAEECGTRFVYVRSPSFDLNSADGRQVARMLAASDAAEAERTGERVSRAARQRAEEGGHNGGRRRYGFLADGVSVDPDERDVLRAVAEQLLAGVPLRAVCADLNRRGVPTTTGAGRWSGQTLRDALTKPSCAGITVHDGEPVGRLPGDPILPQDVWAAVRDKLSEPSVSWVDRNGTPRTAPRYTSTGREPTWLLSGIAKCVCGAPLDAGPRQAYRCRSLRAGPGGGGHVRRDAVALDAYITAVVVERLSRSDAVDLFTRPVTDIDVPALRRKATALREIRDRYAAHLGRGEVPDDMDAVEFAVARRANRDALAEVEARLSTASVTSPAAPLLGAADVREVWERLPLGQRRAVVAELLDITVLPARRGRGFDADAVRIERAKHA